MKKLISYLSLFLFSFMLFIGEIYAANYNISLTSSSVVVGNNVTLTISGSNMIGRFNVSSSNSSVASLSGSSVWIENNSQYITINTKKVGTTVITVTPVDVSDSGTGEELSLAKKTLTITVKAKPVVNNNTGGSGSSGSSVTTTPKPKSSNNYLQSLTVDGLQLDKKFDKETLEYSVTVPAETEKIKINAQLADSRAKVTGTGEVKVSAGLNTFNIVVTSENGSKKTYVLNATVLELEPIEVTVDKEKYTVVRKRKDLPKISEYFTDKDLEIGEEKVEGYYNEKLDYTLVGLKDQAGNIEYYIYKNGKYSLYKEYSFNGTTLQILDKEIAQGYKKTSFIYDSDKIDSYQEVKLDILKNTYAVEEDNDISGNQFYLFYALNVETGKEYLYQYDALEKTVQRYNTLVLDLYKDRSDKYYMYLLGSILVVGVLLVSFSIIIIKMSKKKKK